MKKTYQLPQINVYITGSQDTIRTSKLGVYGEAGMGDFVAWGDIANN